MTVTHAITATLDAAKADVVLRAVRHRNGTERRFQRVVRSETGTFTAETTPWLPTTTRFSNGGADLPWAPITTTAHTDLPALLRATPQLTTVLRHEDTQFTVIAGSISRTDLVDHLRPSAAGLSARSGAEEQREDDDTDLEVAGATSLGWWASVDGEGVVVLDLGSEPSASRSTDLVAVLLDGDEGGLRGSEQIASYSWWSEGEITSWDGGAVVERVGRSAALFRDTGDSLGTPAVVRWPGGIRAQAELLEWWLDRHDAGVAASLCWEPLDPTGRRLTARERTRWEEALEGVSATVEVSDPAMQRALRSRLVADERSAYARTRRALLHPRRPEGEELYERLDTVACGGPLWNLLNG